MPITIRLHGHSDISGAHAAALDAQNVFEPEDWGDAAAGSRYSCHANGYFVVVTADTDGDHFDIHSREDVFQFLISTLNMIANKQTDDASALALKALRRFDL